MQALSQIKTGAVCTIKWMFGTPEVLEFLHRHQIQEKRRSRPEKQRVPSFSLLLPKGKKTQPSIDRRSVTCSSCRILQEETYW